MPRYYFHVRRGQITVLDNEGIDLADPVHAEVKAAQRAQQIVNGEILERGILNEASDSRGTIIVADENWQRLFEIPF